ncbi:MAG: MotA/TolQ/ExbB proton channel family protein [Gammaproteobacteria bacterium]|nr:MotA/TolQ/ExbB proton channel family protein [Gammaproteobacteria bacterium]
MSPQAFADLGRELLREGGAVMPWILGSSVVMWTMILDRYVYFRWRHPRLVERTAAAWQQRRDTGSRIARRLRAQHVADLRFAARRHLPLIRTLIQTLPLLGLLGTVSGLIHTFEMLSIFGGANRRGIASGISEALVATLAGLVTGMSGLWPSADLEQHARAACDEAGRLDPV